ncbi:dihydroxyacetone kinase subunit DhaL [Aeromicrobium sp. Root472D3]|uniref:dihydroxyacetone kinase subunit DhaL n=1 Tax=Aeromicrobium sp. Root472D3 TaxID=1736540 RepID=UPI0006FBF9B0|nr:dihydroxyacetone kinase subunit DhaL [Aeromicrobium sp. Root472D3]KQX74516.1 dihydroxyacetone kinase [Aeromicrobium sp. Root472D3]
MNYSASATGTTRLENTVKTIATTCVANEQYFCDLDSVFGDGDFGYSLARGFEKVLEDWESYDRSDLSTFLQGVAMTMSSRIGGTSGPIWGTAFLRAATAIKSKQSLEGADVVAMLDGAIAGIKKRGGAEVGDKTLLDALVPLNDEIREGVAENAEPRAIAERAAKVARESAEATSTLTARRGRASYTGDRSIGSPDPGAIAMAVLAEHIVDSWA